MGMFDWYVPNPVMPCPKCGATLADWQGKGGPCDLLEWVQGHAEPRTQRGDADFAVRGEPFEAARLPQQFTIYTSCDGCGLWVNAACFCEDEVWTFTDLYLDAEHHGLPEAP